ncbi:XRE family transcriptional regulator [Deinococcus sonorensis]|uniref:XRE family transcriptional regulator n=2 Tax=Deinococcus sonorensis TaxID=309891 RepID=A0AAU7UGC6_9DEIO
MDLGNRLKERRERAALTQEYVARQLGLSREILSTWETGTRMPNTKQLDLLAKLYRTELAYLISGQKERNRDRDLLFQDLPNSQEVRKAFTSWLDFLDNWAAFIAASGESLPGPGRPPRALDQGGNITDARKAPTLAVETRNELKLASDAIHDIETLLDEQNILVYKSSIESDDQKDTVSGAFYNHPELGYCIFVNTHQKNARVRFTLAHEFSHALYHYRMGGIISRNGDKNPREVFANVFAAHFLVPGKALREHINDIGGKEFLDSFQAFRLAFHFNVSYSMMLFRLNSEKLINSDEMNEWAQLNVKTLARKWGIRASDNYFADAVDTQPTHANTLGLAHYPLSVLKRIKTSYERKKVNVEQAAHLLCVSEQDLLDGLLQPKPNPDSLDLLELADLLTIR